MTGCVGNQAMCSGRRYCRMTKKYNANDTPYFAHPTTKMPRLAKLGSLAEIQGVASNMRAEDS